MINDGEAVLRCNAAVECIAIAIEVALRVFIDHSCWSCIVWCMQVDRQYSTNKNCAFVVINAGEAGLGVILLSSIKGESDLDGVNGNTKLGVEAVIHSRPI